MSEDNLPLTDGSLILIGPEEPGFWTAFTDSEEYADGAPDPLDRWSRRVLDQMAEEVGGHAFYPFGGPPYQPFQKWALRTGQIFTSPIGLLMHAEVGLFVSFRGALLVPWVAPAKPVPNPCQTCTDRPCLTACPVGAFGGDYDVPKCKSHLQSRAGEDCMSQGCAARRACPVGRGLRPPAQAAFHMEAFL